ncbi:MAG: hypothetical protein GF346_07520, partial [Candidatus Eisenbacteria bacterium]|nr:hypothetical protein [Candidatus Latescibacterota bacterium]MBD3302281.1 hypothetical protein [Candidatus Eisenbacteria bacterium]
MNPIRSRAIARRLVAAGLLLGLLSPCLATAEAPTALSPRTGAPRGPLAPLEVFWSQAPDLNGSKISSERIPSLGVETEVANDFSSPTDTRVTRLAWWGGPFEWEEGDPVLTNFNLYFYDDLDCAPGTIIAAYDDVVPTRTSEGDDGLGQPVYRYEAPVSVPILGGQTYWVVVQADYHGSPPQWGRQQALESGGCATLVRGEYFGYADWVPASQIAGEEWDASQELEIETPTLEACCDDYGFCQMLLADDCIGEGGTPQGEGTDCDPNPCPEPDLQACCFLDGSCFLLIEQDCLDAEGVPQGEGTDCDPNPCEQTGQACCLPGEVCIVWDPQDCSDSGGTPQGEGTDCDPNPCGPEPEACCLADGFCVLYSPSNCTTFGGEPQGQGTVCD